MPWRPELTEQTAPPPHSRRDVLCGLMVALLAPAGIAACSSGDGKAGATSNAGNTTGGATGGASPTGGGTKGALAKLSDIPVSGGVLVDQPDGTQLLLLQP